MGAELSKALSDSKKKKKRKNHLFLEEEKRGIKYYYQLDAFQFEDRYVLFQQAENSFLEVLDEKEKAYTKSLRRDDERKDSGVSSKESEEKLRIKKYLFQLRIKKAFKKKRPCYLIWEACVNEMEMKLMLQWKEKDLSKWLLIQFCNSKMGEEEEEGEDTDSKAEENWKSVKSLCFFKDGRFNVERLPTVTDDVLRIEHLKKKLRIELRRRPSYLSERHFFNLKNVDVKRLFFFSDLHLSEYGNARFLEIEKNVKEFLGKNGFDRKNDLIVILGDVTANGMQEEFHLVNDLFGEYSYNLLAVPGNHDVSSYHGLGKHKEKKFRKFNEVFFGIKHDVYPYALHLNERHVLILMDSNTRSKFHISSGEFDDDQLEKVGNILKENQHKTAIIAFHHHLYKEQYIAHGNTKNAGSIRRSSREDFFKTIGPYHDQISNILNGHRHLAYEHFLSRSGEIGGHKIRIVNLGCPFSGKISKFLKKIPYNENNSCLILEV